MNREDFLKQKHVDGFAEWLAKRLSILPFRLRVIDSRFVPGGIHADVTGIEAALARYSWNAKWTDRRSGKDIVSCDWPSTRASLGRLSDWLRESVQSGDELATRDAARAVLEWGGVRGALPFIKALSDSQRLCSYLQALAPLFDLVGNHDEADLNERNVLRFDAGLTKIHALLDRSGSPIYDSRVGAAMAMLYRLFQTETPALADSQMRFPCGAPRGQQIRNPGKLGFMPAPEFHRNVSEVEWARWQLRTGWIIREVLSRTSLFASEADIASRCHAFEAALFTIGYDLRCMLGDSPEHDQPSPATKRAVRRKVAVTTSPSR